MLSALLFVLAADLLQSIINKARHQNLLQLPLTENCGQDFPIVQYADDTLLIMEACPRQLFFLRAVLNSFATSTGLRTGHSGIPENSGLIVRVLINSGIEQANPNSTRIFRVPENSGSPKIGFGFG